ncbi:MAG: para-nitrobenzyl esterase [Actinomycetota bacterium]|nr:para-nitrobenzyl esterase [Actinomycetota bacterium]
MALGEIVDTASGPVRGVDHSGIRVFRGIPYAEAPVGDRRFRPPVPRAPWTEPLEAGHAGPLAPQNPSPLEGMLGSGAPPTGEDCLSLNIWTPATDDAARPVLFWIHGGAFVTGSGATPWYDGEAFARNHDVVVVTINYRLGALGFLHLADLFGDDWAGSGNLGILDQSLALRWTSENIAAFGGDASNITIFGESAGGMSVATQLGLPASKGLFRRAIAQSGAAGHVHTRETATDVAKRLLEVLGVDDPIVLQNVPTSDILAAQEKVNQERANVAGGGLPFMPCVDGTTLPVGPQQAVKDGHADGVDLVLGTNQDEMTLFTIMDPSLGTLDDAGLARRLGGLFGEERVTEALDAYRKDREEATAADIWNAALSDRVFRVPAVRLADAQKPNGSTYVYLFTWESTAFDGRLRSCHALEIPFVWDNLDQAGVAFLTGPVTDDMRALATTMNESWAAFARTGNPSTPTLAEWPQWDPETRPTMIIDTDSRVELDPMGHEIEVWSELL